MLTDDEMRGNRARGLTNEGHPTGLPLGVFDPANPPARRRFGPGPGNQFLWNDRLGQWCRIIKDEPKGPLLDLQARRERQGEEIRGRLERAKFRRQCAWWAVKSIGLPLAGLGLYGVAMSSPALSGSASIWQAQAVNYAGDKLEWLTNWLGAFLPLAALLAVILHRPIASLGLLVMIFYLLGCLLVDPGNHGFASGLIATVVLGVASAAVFTLIYAVWDGVKTVFSLTMQEALYQAGFQWGFKSGFWSFLSINGPKVLDWETKDAPRASAASSPASPPPSSSPSPSGSARPAASAAPGCKSNDLDSERI